MLFSIHTETIKRHTSSSGKAIYLTADFGGLGQGREWFPLSQLKIGKPNELGYSTVEIPDWILRQKQMLTFYGALNVAFAEASLISSVDEKEA